MPLRLITPPARRPVSLAQAKGHLRIEHNDDDALIETCIGVAASALDGASGELGRALVRQSWVWTLDAFPYAYGHPLGTGWHNMPGRMIPDLRVYLPLPPLLSVESVTYLDPSGATLTLDSSAYTVSLGGEQQGNILPAFSTCWPYAAAVPDAVSVAFTAGYGAADATDAESAAAVPAPLVAAILLRTGDLYNNREALIIDAGRAVMISNPTIDRLLSPYRVWGV